MSDYAKFRFNLASVMQFFMSFMTISLGIIFMMGLRAGAIDVLNAIFIIIAISMFVALTFLFKEEADLYSSDYKKRSF